MAALCKLPLLSPLWCCVINLLSNSQALGALSTSEDSQVVEKLRVKVEPGDRMRLMLDILCYQVVC